MCIEVGFERAVSNDIQHSYDAGLEMTIADFFTVKIFLSMWWSYISLRRCYRRYSWLKRILRFLPGGKTPFLAVQLIQDTPRAVGVKVERPMPRSEDEQLYDPNAIKCFKLIFWNFLNEWSIILIFYIFLLVNTPSSIYFVNFHWCVFLRHWLSEDNMFFAMSLLFLSNVGNLLHVTCCVDQLPHVATYNKSN